MCHARQFADHRLLSTCRVGGLLGKLSGLGVSLLRVPLKDDLLFFILFDAMMSADRGRDPIYLMYPHKRIVGYSSSLSCSTPGQVSRSFLG